MNEEQPTVEQSLHSAALSLINIHEELVKMRRLQRDALHFTKNQAPQRIIRPAPPPRRRTSWGQRIRSLWPA